MIVRLSFQFDLNNSSHSLGATAHPFPLAENLSLLAEAATILRLNSFLFRNSTTISGCLPLANRGPYLCGNTVVLEVVAVSTTNPDRKDCPALLPRSGERQVCPVWRLRDLVTASLYDA